MMNKIGLALLGVAATALTALPTRAEAAAPLRVIVVDVEGGAATLYVTPQGHSLLVDTGWPAGMGGPRTVAGEAAASSPSSAQRIVAAARSAGLSRIDHVLVTHYHVDHVGGLPELVSLFPIGEVIDHGPNREPPPPAGASAGQVRNAPATLYPPYLAAIRRIPHRVMKAGETLAIEGMRLTVVDSDRGVIARPLGRGPGVACDNAERRGDLGGEENPRSLGFVATWGTTRILAMGDTTWDVEHQLVCPVDRIGPIDLMLADNHGSDNSNSIALLSTVRPRVVLLANGPSKGAQPGTMRALAQGPGYDNVWQIHTATRNAPEENVPMAQIANIEGQPDAMLSLTVELQKDGTMRVLNPRNASSKTYVRRWARR